MWTEYFLQSMILHILYIMHTLKYWYKVNSSHYIFGGCIKKWLAHLSFVLPFPADLQTVSFYWKWNFPISRSVGLFVIISTKGGKFHFYAPIGALVLYVLFFYWGVSPFLASGRSRGVIQPVLSSSTIRFVLFKGTVYGKIWSYSLLKSWT